MRALRVAILLGASLCVASVAAAEPPPCAVRLRAQVTRRAPDRFEVKVIAENLTRRPVELTLPDRCPNGPLDLAGLPPGFNLYGTCAAGPCPGERTPKRVRLKKRARQVLATASLPVGADRGCSPALAPGSYTLTPIAPSADDLTMCVVPATLTVGAQAKTPAPPPPTGDAYACDSDGDCVLSCPSAPGCCSSATCGCGHSIRADHAAAYAASYAKSCRRPPCPAMGCAYEEYTPVCINHRCSARRGPGLGF